ncbi:MAG: hypothetical protein HN742_15935 [Lentisphaerae bacterium]|jgi:hypothetical protein|nr:hypothetical protein [Lentisphaerota bacterium]MBT4814473.1 hypothetical protein [Lentisphaerota bacterium]MBT5608836.1 hypothetical protein [Lentisphaerota bacterium]MBT7061520.1 hypothetical protein [Lentisphaerota bacterium]MBT7843367.1 hypothetical protein [Lentisphaerota bacterium]
MECVRKLVGITAVVMSLALVVQADDAGTEVRLKKLEETVLRQQGEIQALRSELQRAGKASEVLPPGTGKAELDAQLAKAIDERIEASGLRQGKDIPPLLLAKHLEGLKAKGDLRLRYEQHNNDNAGGTGNTDRDRFRTRFRLGGVWTSTDESWQVGAGVATGGDSGTSTNETWSNGEMFETGDLRLDYAYAKHALGDSGVSVTLGQQKNPFVTSWLLWDSDVRPIGATLHAECGEFFATGGAYDVIQWGNSVGGLFAGQIGCGLKGKAGALQIALGYYDYQGDVVESQADEGSGVADFSSGNYDYNIVDLYVKGSTSLGDMKLSAYGDVFINLGADGKQSQRDPTPTAAGGLDPDAEDTGWVLGLKVQRGRWTLGYAYARVEADSAVWGLKDADFGASGTGYDTDIKGHVLEVGYKMAKHLSLGFEADFLKPIAMDDQRETDLYQLDIKYKF